jgi:hypothetical protein
MKVTGLAIFGNTPKKIIGSVRKKMQDGKVVEVKERDIKYY